MEEKGALLVRVLVILRRAMAIAALSPAWSQLCFKTYSLLALVVLTLEKQS